MATFIPTMSMMGWTATPHEKAAYMIAVFIAANYSQSVALYGKITTLQYLVKKHAQHMNELENAVRDAFEVVVQATFPGTANSKVQVVQTSADNPAVFSIRLACEINEGGRIFTVGKMVQFDQSVMIAISDIANG